MSLELQSGPDLGVCYYPEQWPEEKWAEDARQMVELGLSWVRIGEFAWAMIEPAPGQFDWGWLDRAIETLGAAGLKVIMSTPTAAPPKWLVDLYPEILPVGADGQVRKFGARRHYCFSSPRYLAEATRIANAVGALWSEPSCPGLAGRQRIRRSRHDPLMVGRSADRVPSVAGQALWHD